MTDKYISEEDKRCLPHLGFQLHSQKQYFSLNLNEINTDNLIKETDYLEYKNLLETGDEPFIKSLKEIQSQSFDPGSQYDISHPEESFKALKDPIRFDPSIWFMAFSEKKPAGFVLPGIESDSNPITGYIQFIGVLPEFRGKGIGEVLLKKAILEFIKKDAKRYVGSTDLSNIPMQKIFSRLQCSKDNIYDIWLKKK